MRKGIEVTLPVIKKSKILNRSIRRTYKNEKFLLDMSLAAEERFDMKFPEMAKTYGDLYQFMDYARKADKITQATVRSMLKCIYCYFDTKYSYIDFLKLFDFSDINYIARLVEKIKITFNIIEESATQKN